MHFQILFLFIILSFLISCGGNPSTSNNNANTTNTPLANKSNNNSPLGTNKTETTKTGEAPNVGPVVQGYYEALKKKDEAGAKKFLSAAALKYYEDEAKSEKKTWFAFVLEEAEPVADKYEIRNEKIEGERAVAEVKGGNLADWAKIVFVKENDGWKLASPAEIMKESNIKKTETLSNTSK